MGGGRNGHIQIIQRGNLILILDFYVSYLLASIMTDKTISEDYFYS